MSKIASTQTNNPCVSTLRRSFWQSLSSQPRLYGTPALRKISRQLDAAHQAAAVTLATLSATLRVNNRLYLAIAFMLVLAPVANVSYRVFDSTQVVAGWYYTNYYDLFYVLCPWLSLTLFSTGTFLLFPAGSRRAWLLLIPITSAIAKMLWLVQITSNAEFHTTVPMAFMLPALFIAFIWLFLLDWLLARKYHKHDVLRDRIDGLFMANLPAEEKLKHLRTTWTQLKNFHKQY